MTATLTPVAPSSSPTAGVTLSIARQSLKTALGKLAAAVDSSSKALPVAQHLKLDITPGALTMTATDFETFVRLTVSCDATGTATVLLPAKRLAEIVAALPPVGAVTMVVTDRRAVLTAGRARFELVGIAVEEFPSLPVATAPATATVHAGRFLDAIERAVTHASTEAGARPAMCVVRLEPTEGELRVMGLDGVRCLRLTAGALVGDTLPACSMPRTAPAVLARLFTGLPDEATVKLAIDGTRLTVSSEQAMATVRLIDLSFPDVGPQLRAITTPTRVVTCDRLLLSAAMRRVALASGNEHRRITVTLADEITLTAGADALGTATDVVTIAETRVGAGDPPLRFGINASLAIAALDTLTADEIAIAVKSPSHPLLFTGATQEATDPTLALVMPLRLPEA